MKIVWVDGSFVDQKSAVVSIFDRGYLYGDGVFETMRARRSQLELFSPHLHRMRAGAEYLHIGFTRTDEEIRLTAMELLRRNQMPDAVVRMQLTRGIGRRGFSSRGANTPSFTITVHPLPFQPSHQTGWRLTLSRHLLPSFDPCARFKTSNKLPQILARLEAEQKGFDEALMINEKGFMVEAASANLFWIKKEEVYTPASETGLLPGITRQSILDLCAQTNIPCHQGEFLPEELDQADSVFLTQSVLGLIRVQQFKQHHYLENPLLESLIQTMTHSPS